MAKLGKFLAPKLVVVAFKNPVYRICCTYAKSQTACIKLKMVYIDALDHVDSIYMVYMPILDYVNLGSKNFGARGLNFFFDMFMVTLVWLLVFEGFPCEHYY